MRSITWTEDMSVGVEELDDDHRRMIAILATLGSALDGGGGGDPLAVLGEMVEYCRSHFVREEAYMAAIGYPGLVDHRRQHDALTQDVVDALMDQSGEADPRLGHTLHAFLIRWLETHILHTDREYARYAAIGNGEP